MGSFFFSYRRVGDPEPMSPLSHKEIMETQCDLLMSNSRDPKMIVLVKENIGHIFDGSLPHCAGLLKLGLKKAFDLKRQERQPPGVMLRCQKGTCSRYHQPISYLAVTSDSRCTSCNYWVECAGCSFGRTSNCAWCQRCGKRFI